MEKMIRLKDGTMMPKLGQGTWYMGERKNLRQEEINALRQGIDMGMTLIDTAEMYGEGLSEELVGEAIRGYHREDLFLVSKVYPHNAGRKNIFASCRSSLERLGSTYLDLYLLHWRGGVPLKETVQCMEELKAEGLIRNWGVSNFDTDDMHELLSVPHGDQCVVNQVLYHLDSRGIEYDLLPFMKTKEIAVMAYCPMAHDLKSRRRVSENSAVREISLKHKITPEQLMLAFLMAQDSVCPIPKASTREHVEENAETLKISLTSDDLAVLESHFPRPNRKTPLDML